MASGFTMGAARSAACALTVCAALFASGCATPPGEHGAATHEADPWEPLNRPIFEINRQLDRFVLEPAAIVYTAAVPILWRDALHGILVNMRLPVSIANALLQADRDRFARAFGRFAINTTFGVGGIIDVAGNAGLEHVDEDFGQTLAVWGMESGPYLMLPLFGPATVRDGAGRVVDVLFDPVSYMVAGSAGSLSGPPFMAVSAVDRRSRSLESFAEIERNTIDLYAAVRSAYLQRRRKQVFDGAPLSGEDPLPTALKGEYDGLFQIMLEDDFE